MADIRIKDLPTTATQTASDDFIALDGTVNGTRKIDASAPSFKTSVTSPSIVAPAATNLTLAGGSTGASLVLGQGANSPATISTSSAASKAILVLGTTDTGNSNQGIALTNAQANAASRNWALVMNNAAFGDFAILQSNARLGDPISAGTSALTISAARNLLIGTTTDIAGTGGLHVAGTSTASTITSGALRVGSNVGLSGNAGGASYFGGQVVLLPSSGTSRGRINNDPGRADVFNVGGNWNGASQDDNTKPSWFAQIDGRVGGDSYSIQRAAPAGAPTAILSASASGVINIPATTSASSSTVGALTIGNGTAATNVAIGGGNVNAGGTGTFGGAVIGSFGGSSQSPIATPSFFVGHASSVVASVLQSGNVARGMEIQSTSDGSNTGYWSFGYRSNLPAYFEHLRLTGGGTPSAAIAAFAGAATIASSTPSSLTTNGALVVTGGVGVGGALNVGGGIGSYGASTSAGVFAFTSGSMTGTNMYGFTDQTATYTVSSPATEVMGHRVYSTLALGASGTLANWYGFSSTLNSKTGAAVLTNAYAFYANSPTQATNNYAFYSAGTAPSVFGGAIDLGATTTSANAVRWSTDTALYRGAAGYLSMGTAAIGGGFSVQNSSAGGQITVQSAGTPMLSLTDTTQGTDAKIWSIRSSSSSLILGAWPDNYAGISPAITIARSANVPSLVTITPPATFAGAVTASSTAAGGFGQVSITNNIGAAINNYMLGSTYGGTTFGGVTGNNQAVIEASASASSLYLGTGGGSSIVLAPNRTAALTLASGGAATFAGIIKPQQATTAGAPAYVKGAIYFDTTLNKLRVGGATAWETITSV